jgi:CheY-like chemotaxis protein
LYSISDRFGMTREAGTHSSTGSSPTTPIRVLVAEDEVLIALSLSDLLEAEGYEVTVAADGAEALTVARSLIGALDVLLTDLNMPHVSGEELIRMLRTERPGLPVVVVTGSPPEGGAAELQAYAGGYGSLALLSKPIDYRMLIQTLAQAAAAARE